MATKTTKASKPAKTTKSSKSKSSKPATKTPARSKPVAKSAAAPKKTTSKMPVRVKVRHVRIMPVTLQDRQIRMARVEPQFAYMKAPGAEHAFEVGDTVEVYCDHEKNNDRIRGWIKGIVVQVDNKMVAVQFRSNVFLTDGWMVPDRILWYPLTSDQIRGTGVKKAVKKEFIPEY